MARRAARSCQNCPAAYGTHLYPGAQLTPDAHRPLLNGISEAVIIFRDGSRAEALITTTPDGIRLEDEGYVTAARTSIAPKSWQLRRIDHSQLVVASPAV